MNKPQPAPHGDYPTPASAGILFARTHDDLLVAKVGDHAFGMMPGANGRYYLASAWRLCAPMEEWTRADFYSHGGELKDEASFRARVHENAEHQRQRAALGRREIRSRANTPWGVSQGATVYSDGVSYIRRRARRFSSRCRAQRESPSCPSRAGRLVRGRLRLGGRRAGLPGAVHRIRTSLRRPHDPGLVSRRLGGHSWPSPSTGRIPQEGSARLRARSCHPLGRDFRHPLGPPSWHDGMRRHAWRRSPRRRTAPLSRFLGRIRCRPLGFVIDEARHRLYDGPSDFVGWR